MAYCSDCGRKCDTGATFCPDCGTRLAGKKSTATQVAQPKVGTVAKQASNTASVAIWSLFGGPVLVVLGGTLLPLITGPSGSFTLPMLLNSSQSLGSQYGFLAAARWVVFALPVAMVALGLLIPRTHGDAGFWGLYVAIAGLIWSVWAWVAVTNGNATYAMSPGPGMYALVLGFAAGGWAAMRCRPVQVTTKAVTAEQKLASKLRELYPDKLLAMVNDSTLPAEERAGATSELRNRGLID